MKPVNRIRKPLNITLSDDARRMLEEMAEKSGLTMARQIEMMARETYALKQQERAS